MRFVIRKILVIVLIAVGAVTAFMLYRNYARQQTGTEWFNKQQTYMDNMETLTDNMDDALSLYVAGAIGEEDFLTHIKQFQDELQLIRDERDAELRAHPVRPDTETYATKSGTEAVTELLDLCGDMLDMCENTYQDKDTLVYNYMAYEDLMVDSGAKYLAARQNVPKDKSVSSSSLMSISDLQTESSVQAIS